MLTVLVVGRDPGVAADLEPDSSLEVLHAEDAEEAVEKLGRNRRVDAILILPPADPAETLRAIQEDNPSPPPVFLPPDASPVSGTKTLPPGSEENLVEAVARALA